MIANRRTWRKVGFVLALTVLVLGVSYLLLQGGQSSWVVLAGAGLVAMTVAAYSWDRRSANRTRRLAALDAFADREIARSRSAAARGHRPEPFTDRFGRAHLDRFRGRRTA